MLRKPLWLSLALLLVIAIGVGTTLLILAQHVPAFYARSEVPPGPQRNKISAAFTNRTIAMVESIKNGGNTDGYWKISFTEEELNSYFAEHLLIWRLKDKLLPEGVSEPRVAFEKDRVRFGFRYGTPPWSTIVSLDFRVWLAQGEPNVVVLELQRLNAGALPITAQSLLEEMTDSLRRNNVFPQAPGKDRSDSVELGLQVSWYRHNGNPTAVLKFQSDQLRPTAQLRRIDLQPGAISIVGRHTDAMPGNAPSTGPAGNE